MLGVTYHAVQVDAGVRYLTYEMQAGHDHPRHPEEDDVGRGDQGMTGIKGGEILAAVGPSQAGEGHQPGGEPGVQDILILAHWTAAPRAGLEIGSADAGAAAPGGIAVPDRDPVPPPELAGDAPVPDSLEPAGVVISPALRHEPQRPVPVGFQCRTGER